MNVNFIGGGAMAEAIIAGITSSHIVSPQQINVSDHKESRCKFLMEKYHINAFVGAEKFCASSDVLILAIKPQVAQAAFDEIKSHLKKDTLIVSIIAGITLKTLQENFPQNPIIRVMPNTPMSVKEGMSALSLGTKASEKQGALIQKLFASAGEAIIVPEKLIDAVSGLSGSGPAFVFIIIDALADAGVLNGLKRADAIKLAAQTVLGSAKMVLESGLHPGQLRDQVTSPGGTTIEGVRTMEKCGVRGALIDAVTSAVEKSKAMGKN